MPYIESVAGLHRIVKYKRDKIIYFLQFITFYQKCVIPIWLESAQIGFKVIQTKQG